jgi:hypothetical protein
MGVQRQFLKMVIDGLTERGYVGSNIPRIPVLGAWLPTAASMIDLGVEWMLDVEQGVIRKKRGRENGAKVPAKWVNEIANNRELFGRMLCCGELLHQVTDGRPEEILAGT